MVYNKKEYDAKYRASHKKEINKQRASRRAWVRALGICVSCERAPSEPGKRQCATCNDSYNEWRKGCRSNLRLEVLTHYSVGIIPHCACCGETYTEFLCIDHVNGGGSQHAKEIGPSLYVWLRKNSYPEGFRVLCHNCNASIGHYGYCPHNKGVENE